jgi:hypothetical protein
LELSGAWEPPDSSDTSSAGEGQATPFGFPHRNQMYAG